MYQQGEHNMANRNPNRLYLIVHPEVDPQAPGSEGMSAAFERNSDGEILRTRNIETARKWRDRRNEGVDLGEPLFFILAITADGSQQRAA